ncbi:hypothetical protein ATANTOWER_026600 [Ataeniobius toweri]|uniref:Uncharacterized protein n=1 Tax=Ataeniobius toweri TaxID=208326 RepID=A0ABU7AWS5_9TELE|nr:hypothetical protein [Ataeniobius toweri]
MVAWLTCKGQNSNIIQLGNIKRKVLASVSACCWAERGSLVGVESSSFDIKLLQLTGDPAALFLFSLLFKFVYGLLHCSVWPPALLRVAAWAF